MGQCNKPWHTEHNQTAPCEVCMLRIAANSQSTMLLPLIVVRVSLRQHPSERQLRGLEQDVVWASVVMIGKTHVKDGEPPEPNDSGLCRGVSTIAIVYVVEGQENVGCVKQAGT